MKKTFLTNFWFKSFQFIGTAILLVFLLRGQDYSQIQDLLQKVRMEYLGLTLIFFGFAHFLNILRWQYLVASENIKFMQLTNYYSAGLFANSFLPTGLGGDGVRAALLGTHSGFRTALFSTACDRILGIAILILLLPVTWLADQSVGLGISFSTITPFLLFIVLVLLGLLTLLIRNKKDIPGFLDLFVPSHIIQMPSDKLIILMIKAFVLSMIAQLITIIGYWSLLSATNITISFWGASWLLISGTMMLFVPISINGLGLQETTYLVVLGWYNIPTSLSFTFGALLRMIVLLFSLLGGIFSLFWKAQPQEA